MTQVLLLGRTRIDLVAAGAAVLADSRGIELFGGTGLADVRSIMAAQEIDVVIMGAGIPIGDRLAIVEHVFDVSDTTSVHLKDRASGPAGFLAFVQDVLRGLV